MGSVSPARKNRGRIQLVIAYTDTQFSFKWKAPSTSTLVFHWGDGTTSEVAGNDATLVTTTSNYLPANARLNPDGSPRLNPDGSYRLNPGEIEEIEYNFYITGDVEDITYIDISGQAFVSGDASGWYDDLPNLAYMNIEGTSVTE